MGGEGHGSIPNVSPGFARSLKEQAGTIGALIGIVTGLVSLVQTIASNETTIVHFLKIFGSFVGAATAVFFLLLLVWFVVIAVVPRAFGTRLLAGPAWRMTMIVLAVASLALGVVWVQRWAATDWIDVVFGYCVAGAWVWAIVDMRRERSGGEEASAPPSPAP